jgi:hypothetical protein
VPRSEFACSPPLAEGKTEWYPPVMVGASSIGTVIERDCRRVDLSALDWNPARRFYDRLGFTEKTEWVGYRLTGDALRRLADGAPQASIA